MLTLWRRDLASVTKKCQGEEPNPGPSGSRHPMHFTESHDGSNASKDASPEGRMKGASPSLGKAGNCSHCQPMHFQTPLLLTVCLYLPHYQRTNLSRALETSRRSPKEDRPKLEMFILFQTTSWFSFAREHFFGGRSWAKMHWHSRQGGACAPQTSKGLWVNFCKQYYVCVWCASMCMSVHMCYG